MTKSNSRRQFIQGATLSFLASHLTWATKVKAQSNDEENKDFDFIVIGSGAGGAPVACRLAKAGYRVLIVEAGPREIDQNVTVPAFHLKSTEDPQISWDYFVKHYPRPEQHGSKYNHNEGGIFYPRASVLGGCTTHNALIGLYPNNEDWEYIKKITGDTQFSAKNMRKIYEEKVREWLPLENTSPEVAVKDQRLLRMFVAALQEGLRFEGGSNPITQIAEFIKNLGHFDPNSANSVDKGEEGFFLLPKMTREGKRYSTWDLIEETQRDYPHNLFVATDTLVEKILFEDKKAVGVQCLHHTYPYEASPRFKKIDPENRQSIRITYSAKKEIILSAGAFNSPQILMLSGIGDQEHLQEKGIETLVHLPGVGRNLQDRYEMTLVQDMGRNNQLSAGCTFGEGFDPCLEDYKKDPQNSIYNTNGLVAGLKLKSRKNLTAPDLMIFGGPVQFKGYYKGYAKDALNRPDTFTWAVLKGQTQNKSGYVRLKSADPLQRPEIQFNYFIDGVNEDMNGMIEGFKLTRRIVKRFKDLGLLALDFKFPKEIYPGANHQDTWELEDVMKKETWGHHASCSNKMGPANDSMAVVGPEFKVHGVQGLRVVDASVFPKIPGLFIVLPIFILAEKAALDILQEHQG